VVKIRLSTNWLGYHQGIITKFNSSSDSDMGILLFASSTRVIQNNLRILCFFVLIEYVH